MNVKTGLSIYNKQWLIEPAAAMQMLDFWEKVLGGEQWNYGKAIGESNESAVNLQNKFFANSGIRFAPQSSGQMRDFKGFDGASIVVIPVSGPLMKDDNCGDLGTASLKQLTKMASATPSVKTIVFAIDSPGGTVDGTKAFSDEIAASTKDTIAVVDGYMCSAAYWIGSSCKMMYASNDTDVIGSIGTMCALVDNTEEMKMKGRVLREYYATASTDKNKIFSDAAKGDGRALIAELLDPMNNMFMAAVQKNRSGKLNLKSENVLNGKIYLAKEATGAGLIDGIKSFDEIIAESQKKVKNYSLIQSKNKSMEPTTTLAELKSQNPGLYNEAREEGVRAERDRVSAAMVYADVDLKAVNDLIKSGETPTATFFAEMSRKQFSASTMKGMTAGNKTVETEEAHEEDKGDNAAAEAARAQESQRRIAAFKKRQGVK